MPLPLLVFSLMAFSQPQNTPIDTPKPSDQTMYFIDGMDPKNPFKNTLIDAEQAGISGNEKIQFWRAIKNTSSSPNYLVINIQFKQSHDIKTICIPGTTLLSALASENQTSLSQSESIALKIFPGTFCFKNPKSIKLVREYYKYSKSDLAKAKQAISKFTNTELISAFKNDQNFERKLLSIKSEPYKQKHQSALAHAIYQRGLSVGRGCYFSNIWVDE